MCIIQAGMSRRNRPGQVVISPAIEIQEYSPKVCTKEPIPIHSAFWQVSKSCLPFSVFRLMQSWFYATERHHACLLHRQFGHGFVARSNGESYGNSNWSGKRGRRRETKRERIVWSSDSWWVGSNHDERWLLKKVSGWASVTSHKLLSSENNDHSRRYGLQNVLEHVRYWTPW